MLAKQLVPNKFWIVQDRGRKVGTLQKDTNCYYFITKLEKIKFDNMDEIYKTFGENFFEQTVKNKIQTDLYSKEVYGYPTSTKPFNPLYNVKDGLPLFSKSRKSKSLYCAGYYCIQFAKGWVKSFCPKLITLQRYPFKGPFTTDLEMKETLARVSKKS
tara:strand:+ start:2915 stop:3388 length:474 start_codon:yes stop_codon:yes gene_type:complete